MQLPGSVLYEGEPKVDDTTKQAWNDYILWLEKKGLKGHPSLDHQDTSFKILDQYRKENPNTPITKDLIPLIQQDIATYREKALGDIKAGRATGPEDPDNNFMPGLSKVDGIPGSLTTSYRFPVQRLTKIVTGPTGHEESKTTQVQGYAALR